MSVEKYQFLDQTYEFFLRNPSVKRKGIRRNHGKGLFSISIRTTDIDVKLIKEELCADEGEGSCMVLARYSTHLDNQRGRQFQIDHTHIHETGKVLLLNSVMIDTEEQPDGERVHKRPVPNLDEMLTDVNRALRKKRIPVAIPTPVVK